MDARVDDSAIVLAVDLDGTLIAGDILWECLFQAIRANPLVVFLLPFWLLRGKAHFKHQVFSRVHLDPAALAYRAEVIDFLRAEKARGRRLVLATASDREKAGVIAAHLGLFDAVMGSDATTNLRAGAKRAALVAAHGEAGFDYVGNSGDDIVIFEASRRAYVVSPDTAARDWAGRHGAETLVEHRQVGLKDIARLLRVHQWAKNVLIAVPAILDHRIFDPAVLLTLAGAFLAFSLLASSVYIFNDLFDLPLDRRHKTKCRRPLAAGVIDPGAAVRLGFGLVALALAITALLPAMFGLVLVLYLIATTAYSLRIKRWLLLDVLTLAALYTVRVIAGMAAVSAEPSFWLLAFSVFFFLSLALVKRFVELDQADIAEKERLSGRGYRPEDKDVIAQAGMASGFSAIVVLSLYLDSEAVHSLYPHPWMLWPLAPLVLYIIMRIWILARRAEFNDDPVVFIVTDWRSQIMIGLGGLLMVVAGLFSYGAPSL